MAYLVLSNGAVFEGERIGAPGDSLGELVFTTGVIGYLETLTDPSYAGQIVMQTFPQIGNYGVIEEDFEGESAAVGYVVRELCDRLGVECICGGADVAAYAAAQINHALSAFIIAETSELSASITTTRVN